MRLNFKMFFRKIIVFPLLNLPAWLMVSIEMLIFQNYVVDAAVMVLYTCGAFAFMKYMELMNLSRKHPEVDLPEMNEKERCILLVVRSLILLVGSSCMIAAGRHLMGFWILVTTYLLEVLTVYFVQSVKVKRMKSILSLNETD